MSDVNLSPGDDLPGAVSAGGGVHLAAGRYAGGLWIEASIAVQGDSGVVIDAGGRGSAAFVVADDLDVRLTGLSFTRGHGELGGGLRVEGSSKVLVEDCVFDGNLALQRGGHGAGVAAGEVQFVRTRFGKGDHLLLTGAADVRFVDCVVEGDIRVRDGAVVRIQGGRVEGRIDVSGTTTRAPHLEVERAELIGGIHNDEALPGAVFVDGQ